MLDLLKPHYRKTAAYGHFGRTDVDLPWERTVKHKFLKGRSWLIIQKVLVEFLLRPFIINERK